jgi:hypothetical protein
MPIPFGGMKMDPIKLIHATQTVALPKQYWNTARDRPEV